MPAAMHAQIREENPRLARDSKILKVTMDNVYEVGIRQRTGRMDIRNYKMYTLGQGVG